MCFDPMTDTTLAITAATSVAGFMSQQQTYAAQEQQFNQNYRNALSDNRITEGRLQSQEMEENASYAQKSQLAANEGAQQAANIRTAAATGGVAGGSVQELVNGVGEQINLKQAALQTNWQNQVQQTESTKVSAVAQEQSRIGEVANPFSPSPIGAALTIASAGLKAGSSESGQTFFSGLGDSIQDASQDAEDNATTNSGGIGMN